jgi:hypothetical protein
MGLTYLKVSINMNKPLKIYYVILFIITFGFIFRSVSNAAELKITNNQITINGKLNIEDVTKLESLITNSKSIDEIVFENSEGGAVEAAFGLARLIKLNNLNTVAKGKCFSACAYAFLAGRIRKFDSGSQINGLSFHLARIVKNGVVMQSPDNEMIMMELDNMTGNKLPDSVKALIRKSWEEYNGVNIVSKNFYLFTWQEVTYCDGSQKLDPSKCKRIYGVDPYTLGILTAP